MGQFIRFFFKFILFTIVSYVVLIVAYGLYMPRYYRNNLVIVNERSDKLNQRIKDINTYQNVDILFSGSSHVSRGFDTRIFASYGYKCFNLGSSAQTPIQSEILLNEYVKKLHPKLVVLEVYPLFFEDDGEESMLDLIANGPKIGFPAMFISNIKVVNTWLFEYYTRVFATKTIEPPVDNVDSYIHGGFIETKRLFNKNLQTIFKKPGVWSPKKKQLLALNSIIKMLKGDGIKFLLVQMPASKKFNKYLINPETVDDFLRSKGDYYNFNKIITLDDTLNFFDSHHLNQSGVELFDRIFIKLCLHDKKL